MCSARADSCVQAELKTRHLACLGGRNRWGPTWEPNFRFIDLSVITLTGDKFKASYQLLVVADKVLVIDLSVIVINFSLSLPAMLGEESGALPVKRENEIRPRRSGRVRRRMFSCDFRLRISPSLIFFPGRRLQLRWRVSLNMKSFHLVLYVKRITLPCILFCTLLGLLLLTISLKPLLLL